METGEAFLGFQEAEIDFPPTFKYDVLRTIKRSRHSLKRSAKSAVGTPVHEKLLTEIEEQEREEREALRRADDGEEEDEGEATSIASTAWTSGSRYTVDPDENDDPEEEYFSFSPDTVASTRANANPGNVVHKILAASAAHKAKEKWMAIVHSPRGNSPWSKVKRKFDGESVPPSPSIQYRAPSLPPTPGLTPGTPASFMTEDDDKFLKPIRHPASGRTSPTKSQRRSDEIDEAEFQDIGVYDSSHKKRVPSW